MVQLTQEKPERVPLAAFVDRDVHARLFALARREDSSVSRIVRRALAAELEREHRDEAA
jgi:predicted transcriptional regulator